MGLSHPGYTQGNLGVNSSCYTGPWPPARSSVELDRTRSRKSRARSFRGYGLAIGVSARVGRLGARGSWLDGRGSHGRLWKRLGVDVLSPCPCREPCTPNPAPDQLCWGMARPRGRVALLPFVPERVGGGGGGMCVFVCLCFVVRECESYAFMEVGYVRQNCSHAVDRLTFMQSAGPHVCSAGRGPAATGEPFVHRWGVGRGPPPPPRFVRECARARGGRARRPPPPRPWWPWRAGGDVRWRTAGAFAAQARAHSQARRAGGWVSPRNGQPS